MPTDQKLLGAIRVDKYFDWRGKDVSRLEGFSDAAFALMLTLLAVASVVPETFDQLFDTLWDFVAFTLTFAVLVMIWVEHYLFFRRYGIRDGYAIFLNSLLLLLVLFYVYPLKFLAKSLMRTFFDIGTGLEFRDGQLSSVTDLMIFYSAGYFAIFGIFALLYLHAWALRDRLALNPVEKVLTRAGIRSSLIHVAFATTSILLALLIPKSAGPAGLIYCLIGPVMFINGLAMGRQITRAQEGGAG